MEEEALIGLLCDNIKLVYFYKLNEDLPIDLIKFTPNGIRWTDKKIRGIILKNNEWQLIATRFPDAVYNRYYGSSAETTDRLEKAIGKGKVFNCLLASINIGFIQF